MTKGMHFHCRLRCSPEAGVHDSTACGAFRSPQIEPSYEGGGCGTQDEQFHRHRTVVSLTGVYYLITEFGYLSRSIRELLFSRPKPGS